jgi:hypothetical protein
MPIGIESTRFILAVEKKSEMKIENNNEQIKINFLNFTDSICR